VRLVIPTSKILAYDRSQNREGVSIDAREGFFQVITPRLGSWRALSKWWSIAVVFLSFYTVLPFVGAIIRRRPMSFDEIGITVEFTALLGMVLTCAFIQLNRRYVFEITPDRFMITRITFAHIRRRWDYPRRAIIDIHASADAGKLIIRVTGCQMIDLLLSGDRVLAEQVAEALNRGLRETSALMSRDALVHPTEFSPLARQVLIGISAGLACISIILGIAVHPAAIFPPLIAAIIPLGLAMGIQEKKFWT
jgi:hypothetical protein